MALHLRCQTNKGQHILTGLTLSSSVKKLKELIEQETKIPQDCIKVRQGYPPKIVDLSTETDLLSSLPFRSGDTLIIEEDPSLRRKCQENVDSVYQDQITSSCGTLMRKVVPANNSCLFTSIDCVMNIGEVDLSSAPSMRELIAGMVMSDPETYNAVFLGKSNSGYCKWIMRDDSWGGAIEISILAKYYDTEIDVVDTQTSRIDRFGEDMNFPKRVFVIYDGIHYDPLVMEPLIPGEPMQTLFSSNDENVVSQAMEIANEAKAARQYTDVSSFQLRCLGCSKLLTGQKEAQEHAKTTGHTNFGEF